jgi:Ribbon-helix-helix protein, copG family
VPIVTAIVACFREGSVLEADRKYPTRCPILLRMRKTSVYLDEDQAQRLARLAREEGRSQAEVLREAVATYQPKPSQDRNFALAGSGHGDGSSIADVPEEDLLKGFGE